VPFIVRGERAWSRKDSAPASDLAVRFSEESNCLPDDSIPTLSRGSDGHVAVDNDAISAAEKGAVAEV
jgi:hypothetical protein